MKNLAAAGTFCVKNLIRNMHHAASFLLKSVLSAVGVNSTDLSEKRSYVFGLPETQGNTAHVVDEIRVFSYIAPLIAFGIGSAESLAYP